MTELENDIREAHHAISDAMRSDERVDGLLPRCSRVAYAGDGRNSLNANLNANLNACEGASDAATANDGKRTENASEGELSEAEVVARRKATVRLLQTHLWRIRAAGGQLEEMSRQVEDTRQVWELFLDGVRNRTVRLNLQATIATLALTVTAVPASLAGMNIPSGLEHAHPFVFWGITAGLAAASAATWGRFMGIYRGGTGLSSARAADLRALRFVLQRMDELDDAMRVRGEGGKGAVKTRDDLAGVVRKPVCTRASTASTSRRWIPRRSSCCSRCSTGRGRADQPERGVGDPAVAVEGREPARGRRHGDLVSRASAVASL